MWTTVWGMLFTLVLVINFWNNVPNLTSQRKTINVHFILIEKKTKETVINSVCAFTQKYMHEHTKMLYNNSNNHRNSSQEFDKDPWEWKRQQLNSFLITCQEVKLYLQPKVYYRAITNSVLDVSFILVMVFLSIMTSTNLQKTLDIKYHNISASANCCGHMVSHF